MVCLASLSPPQGLCSITFAFNVDITCSNCGNGMCKIVYSMEQNYTSFKMTYRCVHSFEI